jgi:hypothetical protein
MAQSDQFAWVTGDDQALVHERKIGGGGYGVVHQVHFRSVLNPNYSSATN